ncbi:BRCA2-interacting transcriptional repressor EMSY-like [Glandiceps talaboti]
MWPKLLDMSRDESKRMLRRLELEAYASVISAFRAQGDLSKDKKRLLNEIGSVLSISTERHRAEVRRAVNDEKLSTIADHMSGPNNSSEWAIEGRRLVPLMPRLVPQTAFTVTANSAANAAMFHNMSLALPAETGSKNIISATSSTPSTPVTNSTSNATISTIKSPRPTSPSSNVVVLPSGMSIHVKSEPDLDEKNRKRKRSNSSSSMGSGKELPITTMSMPTQVIPTPKTTVLPFTSPKVTTYMTSTGGTGLSPVKITFNKATASGSTTIAPAQKVIIVSSSSSFTPSILQRSQSVPSNKTLTSPVTTTVTRPSIIFTTTASSTSGNPSIVTVTPSSSTILSPNIPVCVVGTATTAFLTNTLSAAKPRPKTVSRQKTKTMTTSASSVLATAASAVGSGTLVTQSPMTKIITTSASTGATKPSIQIVQEHGVKIITQTVPGNKILPKPITIGSGTGTPVVMVTTTIPTTVVMTTKPVTCTAGSQSNQVVINPAGGTRIVTTPSVCSSGKTTPSAGNIITVTPKTLQACAAKTNVVMTKPYIAGASTAGKSNVIIVQKPPTKTVAVTKTTPTSVIQKSLQVRNGNKTIIVTTSSGNQSRVVSTLPTAQPLQGALKSVSGKTQQVVIRPKPSGMQAPISEQVERRSSSPILTELIQQSSEQDMTTVISTSPQTVTEQHVSPGYVDETSSISSATSDNKVEIKHTGDILEAAVAAITNGNQWVEYDVPMPTVSQAAPPQTSTYQEKSASSAIKALLEIQRDPSKETTRSQTIDLSKMAVPIQLPKTESPPKVMTSNPSTLGTSILPDFFQMESTPKPPQSKITGSSFLQTATMEVEKALQERNKALQQQGKIQESDTFSDLTIHKAGNPQKSNDIVTIEEQGFQSSGTGESALLNVPDENIAGQLDPQTGLFHLGDSMSGSKSNLSSLLAAGQVDVVKSADPNQGQVEVKEEGKGHSELLKHLTGTSQEEKEIDPYDFINRDYAATQSSSVDSQEVQPNNSQSIEPCQTSSTSTDSATPTNQYTTIISSSSTGSEVTEEKSDQSNLFSSYSAAEKLSAMAACREERIRMTNVSGTEDRIRITGVSVEQQRQTDTSGKLKSGLIPLQDIVASKVSTSITTATSMNESIEPPSKVIVTTPGTATPAASVAATCVMVESSNLDTSHMNLEDFTSQRLLHEEDHVQLRREENIISVWEEQPEFPSHGATGSSSGSGTESTSTSESCLAGLRASKRKRKAPIPLDEAPIPSNLPSWVRAALNLLQRVSRYRGTNKSKGELNAASWFTRPVDPSEAPGYHKIIKQPMDFGTVKRKLETGLYGDFNDFHNDMLLVRTNCLKYNPPGHEARKDCEEVFQFYTVEFNKMIEKWQKVHCTPPKSPKKPRTELVRSPPKT